MYKLLKKMICLFVVLSILLNLFSCKMNVVEKENNIESIAENVDMSDVIKKKINMSYVATPLNIPSIVDKENDFYLDAFKSIKYDLKYVNLATGMERITALASGSVDIVNAIGDTSVIIAASKGMDVKIISMYSRCPKAFTMFSNDANINTPKDLKGKKVGGVKGSNLHELLVSFLKSGNMTEKDVEFVNMNMQQAVAALTAGSIDVALISGAPVKKLLEAGKHKICDGEGYISASVLNVTTEKYEKNNPFVIYKFKETQNEIIENMKEYHDDAILLTAEELDMEEEDVLEMEKDYDFNPTISKQDIENLQKTEEFLYENGFIDNHVNVQKLIL